MFRSRYQNISRQISHKEWIQIWRSLRVLHRAKIHSIDLLGLFSDLDPEILSVKERFTFRRIKPEENPLKGYDYIPENRMEELQIKFWDEGPFAGVK